MEAAHSNRSGCAWAMACAYRSGVWKALRSGWRRYDAVAPATHVRADRAPHFGGGAIDCTGLRNLKVNGLLLKKPNRIKVMLDNGCVAF